MCCAVVMDCAHSRASQTMHFTSTNTVTATLKFYHQPQSTGEFKISSSWMMKDNNCGDGLPK
jgi:hypothetical protein